MTVALVQPIAFKAPTYGGREQIVRAYPDFTPSRGRKWLAMPGRTRRLFERTAPVKP
jgi:hypothetical protein